MLTEGEAQVRYQRQVASSPGQPLTALDMGSGPAQSKAPAVLLKQPLHHRDTGHSTGPGSLLSSHSAQPCQGWKSTLGRAEGWDHKANEAFGDQSEGPSC